jgi:hypothetical protein
MSGLPLWSAITLPAIGYATATGTEVFRRRREHLAARENWLAERQLRRADERYDQELRNLQAATDALTSAMRAAMRYHLDERRRSDAKTPLDPGWRARDPEQDARFRLALLRSSKAASVIVDDTCRAAVVAANSLLARWTAGYDPRRPEEGMGQATEQVQRAFDVMGDRMRAIHRRDL